MDNYTNNLTSTLDFSGENYTYYDLEKFADKYGLSLAEFPYSIRILLENLIRNSNNFEISNRVFEAFDNWSGGLSSELEVPFLPARVLMQDFTGVPAVVDFAALREEMKANEASPGNINPLIPAALIIDHSNQVDEFGSPSACEINQQKEFQRNEERYVFLRWGQEAFSDLQIVPPGQGIIHQVNLEYFGSIVKQRQAGQKKLLIPDTLLGTDSHTTMINGLGTLGWGVGGIEAEAVMVGEPYYMLVPEVVGVRLKGELTSQTTATDLVLYLTKLLRDEEVVGKFVEYFGPGTSSLSLPDRATVSNMTPEYGATMGYFPPDEKSLEFLEQTGRGPQADIAREYCRQQGLLYSNQASLPRYKTVLEVDMNEVKPAVAGPTLPHQYISLTELKSSFSETVESESELTAITTGKKISEAKIKEYTPSFPNSGVEIQIGDQSYNLRPGALVIAALASCTNTSNPGLMITAGIFARNAVERGLDIPAYVKTSLAPGSRVVSAYLEELDLMEPLAQLNFNLVGYGCSSCIGNSGPLHPEVVKAIEEENLFSTSVICGNRNFEGRISPYTRANYLVSPPLVIAFALAGTVDINFQREPLGIDDGGNPVYLADLWPEQAEVATAVDKALTPELFEREYEDLFAGDALWRQLEAPAGEVYDWQTDSTYIKCPPFVEGVTEEVPETPDIDSARCLALLGDSITTDHISPAGDIPVDSPAGEYLLENSVKPEQFNTYGSRRGNHEVMMRGTFGNIRLDNKMVEKEGGYTVHFPSGEQMSIFAAAQKYRRENVPLVVLAGKQYGTGSSRDWAAKGTELLGVEAVVAESYERIHRANLIGMGVLPLQFKKEESWSALGLTGNEKFSISGLDSLEAGGVITVEVETANSGNFEFEVLNRIDTDVELKYYRQGGILPAVLRDYLRET